MDIDTLLVYLEEAYFDCRRHKRHTINAIKFEVSWEENLYKLYLEIKNRSYKVGRSITFVLVKGVKAPREISCTDKNQILTSIPLLRKELDKIRLRLNENKFYLQHYTKGIKFAGSVIKPGRTYSTKRVVTNFIRKIYGYNLMSKRYPIIKLLPSFISGINSYLGTMSHHYSYGLRRKILKNLDSIWFKYFCIQGGFKKLYIYKRYRVYYQTIPKSQFDRIYRYGTVN